MKIVGIHLLIQAPSGRWMPRCEFRRGGWPSATNLDGVAGDAICVFEPEAELVTCPWCLGAKNREHARRIVARMYAQGVVDE